MNFNSETVFRQRSLRYTGIHGVFCDFLSVKSSIPVIKSSMIYDLATKTFICATAVDSLSIITTLILFYENFNCYPPTAAVFAVFAMLLSIFSIAFAMDSGLNIEFVE